VSERHPSSSVLRPDLLPAAAADQRDSERRLRLHVAWALLGTALALGLLLLDVRASGNGILRPIRAGARGPAAPVIARDFPTASAPDEVGLDGQQFYAMARDPFHPRAVAPALDWPQYRYQRPLYPILAWALHPSGGGPGLVLALVAVSLAGIFIGALALGALSDSLRGPPWLALLYPLLPGMVWALTSSAADALAVSLSLVTVAATIRGRLTLAWAAAIAAVLTRETTILVPIALVLARRRKEDLPLVILPGLILAAWLVFVRLGVPAGDPPSEGLVLPLSGLLDALHSRWLHGKELIGMASRCRRWRWACSCSSGGGARPSCAGSSGCNWPSSRCAVARCWATTSAAHGRRSCCWPWPSWPWSAAPPIGTHDGSSPPKRSTALARCAERRRP